MGRGGKEKEKEKYNFELLESIAVPKMNYYSKKVDNWYLFHEDRLYAYLTEDGRDELFSVDMYGYDKQIISTSKDVRLAEMQLIHKGYLYYYTTYNTGVKKINLKTGEIIPLKEDRYLHFLPETQEDSTVVVTSLNNYAGKSNIYVGVYNLDTNELIQEVRIPRHNHGVYYHKESNKLYSKKKGRDETMCIYENGIEIYRYKTQEKDSDVTLYREGDYLYIQKEKEIIKLDIKTKEMVGEGKIGYQ